MSEYEDNDGEEIVKVKKIKKASKIPSRTWIFGAVSFVSLLFSVLLQRIVTLAPQGSKVSTLFIYQSLSTAFSWTFVVAGAGAVFTALAYTHNRELVSRLAVAQKNITNNIVSKVSVSQVSVPLMAPATQHVRREGDEELHS